MSLSLKNKEWNEFFLNELFDIYSTSSGIDRNKLDKKLGNIPYITRGEKDNGYDSFVHAQDPNYKMDLPNTITIGLDTQTVFYQPFPFYTGQNIQVLASKALNKYIALFFIPLIIKQMVKFNWGGNGATLSRLKRSKILLPTTFEGKPDYAFMEEYVKQKEGKKNDTYRSFIQERLSSIEYIPIISLPEKEWKEFFIEEVAMIKSGERLTKSEMKKGDIPFVGATDSNNGITTYVSNVNNSLDKDVLGVNYNGSVVENFYHPYQAVFSDDVKRLSLRESIGNKHVYLFLKTTILQQKSKYQYGYKFNGGRMARQKIMLPVNPRGNPDYKYMEQYMKNIEYTKLKSYLDYKGR